MMDTNPILLPDCRTRQVQKVVKLGQMNMVPLFCANCGCDGGLVPEENCNFAFYQCMTCSEKYGDLPGIMKVPDDVFWQRVEEEQLSKYGRILEPGEMVEVLKDDHSSLSLLAKERVDYNKIKMH